MMEKRMSTTLEYESINDRISRLRKQATCLAKAKQRNTVSSSQDRTGIERVFETNKQANRLKIDDAPMKIDLTNLSLLSSNVSQRKIGISKRAHCRFTTQDNKKEQQNKEQIRPTSTRIPGKIYKNAAPKARFFDMNYVLSLNSKNI